MKRKILLGYLCFAMAGCAAPKDMAPTPNATPTRSVAATPTATFHPTRIFTRTPRLAPTNAPTQSIEEILEPEAQELFGVPAKPLVEFFLKIQSRVHAGDSAQLAEMIFYPIPVYPSARGKVVVRSRSEFIALYPQFATEKWKEAVLAQEPEGLFMNYQGIMIGSGEIWFSPVCEGGNPCRTKYYIIAINPAVP